MLFLHAILLFVLGTSAAAVPVSPSTSSFSVISRRGKTISKLAANFPPSDSSEAPVANPPAANPPQDAHPVTSDKIEKSQIIGYWRSPCDRNEPATKVMFIGGDGIVQLYHDPSQGFSSEYNSLDGDSRWAPANQGLIDKLKDRPSKAAASHFPDDELTLRLDRKTDYLVNVRLKRGRSWDYVPLTLKIAGKGVTDEAHWIKNFRDKPKPICVERRGVACM